MNMNPWIELVAEYVDDLHVVVEALDTNLQRVQLLTNEVDTDEVTGAVSQLQELLKTLEEKLLQRDALLAHNDAPSVGVTLTEKLRRMRGDSGRTLAKRCEELGHRIQDVNQRAMALFVCQFHLADLSGHLVHLIAGAPMPVTYGPVQKGGAGNGSQSQTPPNSGGGLFSESA